MATVFKQISNVELRWAYLAEPNTTGNFPTNKYQVTLVMDEAQKEIFDSLPHPRQKLKERDGKYEITLKSSKKPRVVDVNGIIMSDEDVKSIGNGTIASVRINQYTGYMNQSFVGLSAIKVNDLKRYTPNSDSNWEDDGYSANGKNSQEEDDVDFVE